MKEVAFPRLRLNDPLGSHSYPKHCMLNPLRMEEGRKNFLFVGHEDGGHNLAVLQTIVATCKLHEVNPYDYFKDVLIRVQSHPASRIDGLLPQNWKDTVSKSS